MDKIIVHEAFKAGYLAYMNFLLFEDNPHDKDTVSFNEWNSGWLYSEKHSFD